ncbi:hypothetical protein GCM10018793_27080 [Streptomyces sulfonofaciens]|uniref:Uncharacterized protein n=1 Tax=Streptomyces sulfonofaciens TaxID=68272 RepID=A0A919KYY5_9ACTN|nr:DUF6415 family natural product biosynthesis protein [Streptomyces sulfonofaciens]GHH77893.1 hypothetical protein GCM10018793_27080 [Streptomyces sulfonofaciens]
MTGDSRVGVPGAPTGVDPERVLAAADQALAMVSGPLPRYRDVLALSDELREFLRSMVAHTAPRITELRSASRRTDATGTVTEARYRLSLTSGEGLQSAADQARALALILRELCSLYTAEFLE